MEEPSERNVTLQNLTITPAVAQFAGSSETAMGPHLFYDTDSLGYTIAKRTMDMIGAALLLGLCFPVMLAVAVLIKITSPGPVLFRQVRLGRHGVVFTIFKFRTMVQDAEQQMAARPEQRQAFEQSYKLAGDWRVTPVGRILRKTSLDELPQLINILAGSMSLIGPRPIRPDELSKYREFGAKLLCVKPGLGGRWQAGGRSDTTYAERVMLDMNYIDNRSLWLDLLLLGKTAIAAYRCRGAY